MQPQDSLSQPPASSNNPGTSAEASNSDYHSNPFAVTVHGLSRAFAYNGTVSILLGLWLFAGAFLLYLISFIFVAVSPALLLFGFLVTMLWIMVWWMAHIALMNASIQGQSATTGQFLSQALRAFPKLIVLSILTLVIVLVGLILLIIPGLIFLARLSLAPYAMLAENLGPVAALKRSWQLVKGHVFEMYGAMFAGTILAGQGVLTGIISAAGMGARYAELRQLKESGAPKPKIHWLNFLLPVLLLLMTAGFVALLFATAPPQNPNPYQNEYQLDSGSFQSE